MMRKSRNSSGNFTSGDRLLAHWKERRRAAGRNRSRARSRDMERLIDPDFDDIAVDDLFGSIGFDPDLRNDSDA